MTTGTNPLSSEREDNGHFRLAHNHYETSCSTSNLEPGKSKSEAGHPKTLADEMNDDVEHSPNIYRAIKVGGPLSALCYTAGKELVRVLQSSAGPSFEWIFSFSVIVLVLTYAIKTLSPHALKWYKTIRHEAEST